MCKLKGFFLENSIICANTEKIYRKYRSQIIHACDLCIHVGVISLSYELDER